jgi:hypothetical protein
MNLNASIYGNAVPGMAAEFGVETSKAAYGQMIFLLTYAFGCELWAPWVSRFLAVPRSAFALQFSSLFGFVLLEGPHEKSAKLYMR